MLTAIIQARLNSKRLPRKVLLPFNGHTILDEVYHQARNSVVDKAVLAVPESGFSLFHYPTFLWQGDEDDLISRHYKAAVEYHADPIVRITSDCPLILPEVIDLVIREHFLYDCDYTYNRCDDSENGWPDGLDVEVFSFKHLQRAYILAKEREHMTWLRENGTTRIVKPDKDYGPCTSINTQEDYELALEYLRGRQNGGTSIR
jgi:spore coat polysaccharide biosynthesis protein SpsF (cytidylyltransferase family)